MDFMIETVKLLNDKGYKVKESFTGVTNPYYTREHAYWDVDLKIDVNGDKYMYIFLHGWYPVKYILLSEDSEEYLEYVEKNPTYLETKTSMEEYKDDKYGVFKVIWISTYCKVSFVGVIDIPFLPEGFEKEIKECTIIYKKIMCDKEVNDELEESNVIRRDEKDIEQDIITANKLLFEWAKELPML